MREQSPSNSSALGGITSGWEGIAALDGTFRYGFESCDMTHFFFLFLLIFFTQCTIRCETTSQV